VAQRKPVARSDGGGLTFTLSGSGTATWVLRYRLGILLATCVRGIELASAKKEDLFLNRGVWWIPDEAVKTRKGFLVSIVPLTARKFRSGTLRPTTPDQPPRGT
jgi:integrase